MEFNLKGLKIAFLGGSDPCKEILSLLLSDELKDLNCQVLGVADTFNKVAGLRFAKENNLFTTNEYQDILKLESVDLIIQLTRNDTINKIIEESKPANKELLDLDNNQALALLSYLKNQREKIKARNKILNSAGHKDEVEKIFEEYSAKINKITDERINKLQDEWQDLIEIEKELSQIIHGSMVPTFIINSDHIITHWNQACEELTGYKSYELIGTDKQWVPFRSAKRPTMADVIVGEMSEKEVHKYYGHSWRKSALIKEAYEAEEFFPHLGENGKWIFFTAAPIKTEDGKVIGAIETLRDKTQDKKAQAELEFQDQELAHLYEKYKNSEEKYRSLFNNNPNPIFIIDSQTLEILDVNHRVEIDYGYKKNEILGTSYLDIGEKEDETIFQGLINIGKNESKLFTKKKHFRKGKKSFYVNVKVCNATYSHREVLIASATDITESVEKETQLIQAGKMATLGTMAAGMAHEINQPLNVIQICADLMLKMVKKGIEIPNDEIVTISNDIIDNVSRAAGVIKHVRDFARQSERALKKLQINDPIKDVFKVLGHQLAMHQIKVELNLDDNIPEIRAEHNRLEQVFINLVTNAIDSMDERADKEGSYTEKLLKIETFTKEDKVVALVADTGTGMTKEIKDKIFEPFFTTKETGKGTGLGTSISFGIIKDYKGTIEIESEPGKGAVFKISFPVIS